MKANNLTICINAKCGRKCPYCVSEMTFSPEVNEDLFYRNMSKAKEIAKIASVSSVLLTSKGEPLNNLTQLTYCLNKFIDFPTEIQTNGVALTSKIVEILNDAKLNTIAISIDRFEDIIVFEDLYKLFHKFGINIRLTIILSDLWHVNADLFLRQCKELGIKQITFRRVTVPGKLIEEEKAIIVNNWINQNTTNNHKEFLYYFYKQSEPKNLIRELSFGVKVYDIQGIAITTIPYCIQENNNTEDIRSLIYHQDGHMYTSWDKKASILF